MGANAGAAALFDHMAACDGVAATSVARRLEVSWALEQRLVDDGTIERVAPGVIRSCSAPLNWSSRLRTATLAPGGGVISHGAAARLHSMDGFDRYDRVDVLCKKGWWPNCPDDTITHFTRGQVDEHVVDLDGIPALSVGATLALLAATDGIGATARALDSMLRAGWEIDQLRDVALQWTRRGRAGPRVLRLLLDERDGKVLPASWFQRLAKRMLHLHLVRMVDEYPIHSRDGHLLARLDLASPDLKIGVECQSWRWYATPEAQHRDARRRGKLRGMGWEIVDVWWRDLDRPDRVVDELSYLVRSRVRPRTPDLSA